LVQIVALGVSKKFIDELQNNCFGKKFKI